MSGLIDGETSLPRRPSAIVSGGTAGLGLVIVQRLLTEGYCVTVVGRSPERIAAAREACLCSVSEDLSAAPEQRFQFTAADATSSTEMERVVKGHLSVFGGLNVLVNVVGQSDRGLIEKLTAEKLVALFRANVISSLVCSQACLPHLRKQRGVIVNIGSLASRVAPRFLGGYVTVKHALAGLTRQLRLECEPDGVHVGLVCPGPIQRSPSDASEASGNRYGVDEASGIPAEAARPAGGAEVTLLTAETVADAVMRCIVERKIEIMLPAKTRLLMSIGALWPSLGDRILRRKTSGGE